MHATAFPQGPILACEVLTLCGWDVLTFCAWGRFSQPSSISCTQGWRAVLDHRALVLMLGLGVEGPVGEASVDPQVDQGLTGGFANLTYELVSFPQSHNI